MTKVEQEVLLITQEECAEVTQAISKIFRFGMSSVAPNGVTNKDHLNEEIGDLLCMIQLMIDKGLVDKEVVDIAKTAKLEKLKKWSCIND